jgi:hypothetical protein
MDRFEHELSNALRRQEPAPDFTERVLAAAEIQKKKSPGRGSWISRMWAWRIVPVLAALLLVFGFFTYKRHERTAKGQQAKQELLMAMRIAGSKLYNVQVQIKEVQ